MTVVLPVDSFIDEPLSPELVLVSPPEIARLARERLSTVRFAAAVAASPREAVSPVTASFAQRHAGLAGFYAFSFLATVGPFVLTILLGSYE